MLNPMLQRPGARFREILREGPVLLPGVFNAISAKAASAAGAKGLYMTGAGVTNALLAVPDIALLTLSEMAQQASYVTSSVQVPVIADADTGYGETMNVIRTVRELERSGLAGIHLEDQVAPKRCGHLDGKALITAGQMGFKIKAAVEAKTDPAFMIIARTDARGVEGIEAAVDRAKLYVDSGADAVFPEGLTSESEFERFRQQISVPLLGNMTEFGKTPIIPFHRFCELGYEMVIYPMTAFRLMLRAIMDGYEELLQTGTQAGLLERMKGRAELYELLEYDAYMARDEQLATH